MEHRNSLNLMLDLSKISQSVDYTNPPVTNDDDHRTNSVEMERPIEPVEANPLGCPDPTSPDADGLFDCFKREPMSPGGDSDFDDGLAVPASLSIIDATDKTDGVVYSNAQTEGPASVTSFPFSNIHHPPVKFKSVHRKVFIPGVEIKVQIVHNERSVTAHLLSPNLYTILLTHGDFKWIIKKRYKHVLSLHQELILFRTSLNLPIPTKTHREKRESFRINVNSDKAERAAIDGKPLAVTRRLSNKTKKRIAALPRFPKKPEILVSYDDLSNRIKQIEEYLYNLCNITIYRNHYELVNFLEASHLSFIADLGTKGKEGIVMKRARSTLPGQTGCDCCGILHYGICNRCSFFCSSFTCGKWRERWFFLKDSCFGYICPKKGTISGVMLFDQGFEISSGMYSTGLGNGLQVLNLNRQMVIRLWNKRQSKDWKQQMQDVSNSTARDFTAPNPHHSFAPLRSATKAFHFVDGAGYFNAVADCLEGAKEEIYITDWWLSPEIYLKRPATGDYWRLDNILKRKAAQGVKVFILLYKEVEMALGINSYYSKCQLASDNIKVLRHPDHAKVGVFLWAHHEKIVCVDQSIAFIGGIDLCYGRWDDHNHRLTDLGSAVTTETDGSVKRKTKKKTSSNPVGRDDFLMSRFGGPETSIDESVVPSVEEPSPIHLINDPTKFENIPLSPIPESPATPPRTESPLPTLEPGDNLMIPPKRLSGTVFLEEHYNPEFHHKKSVMETITGKSKDFLSMFGGESPETNSAGIEDREKKKAEKYAASNRNLFFPDRRLSTGSEHTVKTAISEIPEDDTLNLHDRSVQEAIKVMDTNTKLWVGKDYANFIVKDFINLDSPFDDLVDRSTTPRMPWHDIAVMVEGAAARDAARHFIQRWNAHKLEKFKSNLSYPYLLPKTYTDINVPDSLANIPKYTVTSQILRSLTCWSGGFIETDSVEQSIHEAYIESITRAQHYVYIENQFFITLSLRNIYVRNQIGEALLNRIMRAHRAGTIFRVFVVMPLLPAFEGEVGAASGVSLHAITHWNYQSISRGEESLIQRLKKAGVEDPSKYITFHGLRTHFVLEGEPVTELVYVHSKLMIVDDRVVICGSANINDRSMLGKRDSEVAVLIQDESFEEGRMNGEIFPSGSFAGSLRKRLFREHLGLIDRKDMDWRVDLKDPTIDSFYRDVWIKTSQNNTDIYENVFHCIPTDSVKTFAGLKKYQEENKDPMWVTDPIGANIETDKIRGQLVNFPLEFLCDEVLTPPNTSMEGMMPISLWT